MPLETETQAGPRRPEPPTRERIEQARQQQWRTIMDLRRRILEADDRSCES